jgi:biofilm protein TabA
MRNSLATFADSLYYGPAWARRNICFWRIDIMDKRIIYRRLVTVLVACVLIFGTTSCSVHKEAKVQMERNHIIINKLQHAERYFKTHPAFEKAFTFLRQDGLAKLPADRYEIDGDRLFCMISKGPGRSRSEAKLEAHRKYIDIQYVIAGTDEMGWKPTADCKVIDTEYDDEKDIMFFKDSPDSWTEVPAGSFVIFFPQDAHAPLVGSGEIHKAVLKVAVE